MRPTERSLSSMPCERTCSPSSDADQCVTGSPTSLRGRHASASSTRAASDSERERPTRSRGGRPPVARIVALEAPTPCFHRAHMLAHKPRCPSPALPPPSSAPLATEAPPAAPPSLDAMLPRYERVLQRSKRAVPSDAHSALAQRPPCSRPCVVPTPPWRSLAKNRRDFRRPALVLCSLPASAQMRERGRQR
jgi:hypothetical protein